MREVFYNGTHGNFSLHQVSETLSDLAANKQVKLSERLSIGTEIVGVRVIHDKLGTNTKMKVSLAHRDGSKTELANVDTATKGATAIPMPSVYIGDVGPSDLLLTNSGTAKASGDITVQLEYRYKGY